MSQLFCTYQISLSRLTIASKRGAIQCAWLLILMIVSISSLPAQVGRTDLGLGSIYTGVDYEFDTGPITTITATSEPSRLSHGLTIRYQPIEEMVISTGLFVNKQNIRRTYNWASNWVFAESQLDSIPFSSELSISSFKIPVYIGFPIDLSNRVSLTPSLGVLFSMLRRSTERSTFLDTSKRESDFYLETPNAISGTLVMEFMLRTEITPRLSLDLGPSAGRGLISLEYGRIDRVKTHFGGRVTLSYLLNTLKTEHDH